MNGAQALIRTLVDAGVDVCFANPGTSEMHFVAALDDVPEMRGGAHPLRGRGHRRRRRVRAHGRPPRRDAAAPRARAWATAWPTCTTPAAAGRRWSTSSATTRARTSGSTRRWSPTSTRSPARSRAGCAARCRRPTSPPTPPRPSRPRRRARLHRDADPAGRRLVGGRRRAGRRRRPARPAPHVAPSVVEDVAAVLALGEPTVLFLGGDVMDEDGLLAAAQVAAGTGARLMSETFPARSARGAGLPDAAPAAVPAGDGDRRAGRAPSTWCWPGRPSPVHFFGYPGVPGHPVPEDCTVHVLSRAGGGRRRRAAGAGRAGRAGRRAGGAGGRAAGAADRRADPADDGGGRRRAAARRTRSSSTRR